jgi:hypothetical protein
MGHNPSEEVNRFSASQELPRILWNPKFYYRDHKHLSLVHILSQMLNPSINNELTRTELNCL